MSLTQDDRNKIISRIIQINLRWNADAVTDVGLLRQELNTMSDRMLRKELSSDEEFAECMRRRA